MDFFVTDLRPRIAVCSLFVQPRDAPGFRSCAAITHASGLIALATVSTATMAGVPDAPLNYFLHS
ncbi:MAG: hypothetical protein ACREUM_00540, partial [Nitrosospira sp.]